MKKTVLLAVFLVSASLTFAQHNFHNMLDLPAGGMAPVFTPELKEAEIPVQAPTRSSCTDKIKYVDRSGAPAAGNKIYLGGTIGWAEHFQVYPQFNGVVTRVDFQGGNFGSTESVTVRIHPLSGGVPSLTILASAVVSVNSASGEFGAAFSSPVTVSGGFAVSVAEPASSSDSIYVYYTDQTDGDGLSYLYGSSMYNVETYFGADIDMVIRPTIQFTVSAPDISVSPATLCEGSSIYVYYDYYSGVSWTSTWGSIYWQGWGNETVNFGDASSGSGLPQNHTYASPGTYTVSLTTTYQGWSGNCISDPGTQVVTVNPGTNANFEWSSTNLAVNFTNLSSGASTYSWLFGDGGTATAPNPVHNYASSGTYTVELTATGSCGSNTMYSNISITDSTNEGNVGYIELENGLLTNIYPNPANDQLNIDLSLEQADQVNLQVINTTGQVVYTKDLGNIKSQLHRIDINNYQAGVYFLRIVHGSEVSSRTFLKN